MAFDQQYYKCIHEIIHYNVFVLDWCPTVYVDMYRRAIIEEDYERAKAVKDVVDEWLRLNDPENG